VSTRINERFQPVSSTREPLVAQQSRPAAAAEPQRTGPAAARTSSFGNDGFEGRARQRVDLGGSTPPPAVRPTSLPASSPAPAAAATPITQSVSPKAPIEDNKTVTSTMTFGEDVTVDSLKLDLDLQHTYRGDLVVSLTSPSGKSAVISNKQGGSADDLKGSFDLSAFAGEKATGTWTLSVQDTARQDTGTLNSWGLTITPKGEQPPPPDKSDSDPMKHIEYLASDELKGRDSPSEG
jgi:subtilisin-like proprotein convertase family protein